MELGLTLGDNASKTFGCRAKAREINTTTTTTAAAAAAAANSLGFCMALGIKSSGTQEPEKIVQDSDDDDTEEEEETGKEKPINCREKITLLDPPPVQLDLLPLAPVPRRTPFLQHALPWSSDNGSSEGGSSGNVPASRGFDVNRLPEQGTVTEEATSSFRMDMCIYRSVNGGSSKRDFESMGNDAVETGRTSSRASDEDENSLSRKKLRLSKQQSAYLEESFKEHNTLNPKQKLALAKQLNLRPRQVEVWFQNRRARTKLKQTEVDCEYLKRCCETLTEENRRLHKELHELRALKSSNPFYMQLPATTLTMCPSCERVATASTTNKPIDPSSKATPFPISSKPRSFFPFSHAPTTNPHQSASS